MSNVINERTSAYLTVVFRDRNGAPATPTALSYRIDCLSTSTEILAPTALALASTVEIHLTPTQTRIVSPANAHEQRRVTVSASYGAADGLNDEYDFVVRNLSGVT